MNRMIRTSLFGMLMGGLYLLPITAAEAVPYQKYLNATSCPTTAGCNIDFPNVPAGKRLEISSASCYLRTSLVRDLSSHHLLVVSPNGTHTNAVTLVPQQVDSIATPSGLVWSASHSIFAFANAGQHFRAISGLNAGAIKQFACSISGEMVTLP